MMKNLVIWLVIGLVLMTVFNQFNTRQSVQAPMEYSQFLDEVKGGRIAKVLIEGRVLKATNWAAFALPRACIQKSSGSRQCCVQGEKLCSTVVASVNCLTASKPTVTTARWMLSI